MVLIALKRLWNRPLLTLLSIVGVVLAVGLVTGIPILTEALSFVMLKEELDTLSAQTGRPLFSVRVYVMPLARYPLSLEHTRELADRIEETLVTEIGLPVLSLNRHMETTSFTLRSRDQGSSYGKPKILLTNTTFNLQFLYDQIGGTYLHYVWLKIDPDSDREAMMAEIEKMGVHINLWVDARDGIAQELAKTERVGIFGILTTGFLGAALLSGIGLLVYNYASLQERLFRFTALRAVGLSLRQIVSQVSIEYLVLMAYSIAGGAGIGAWASSWFIPFFQAADKNVIDPPMLLPRIAWGDIHKISAVFVGALVIAQIVVISSVLRSGVFQALRMGDRE